MSNENAPQQENTSERTSRSWRERASHGLALLSIALLAVNLLMIVWMYVHAWRRNLYPWTEWTSQYHGPWNADSFLVNAWEQAFFFPQYVFVVALASLLAKPNVRASVVMFLCFAVAFTVLLHVGLVED